MPHTSRIGRPIMTRKTKAQKTIDGFKAWIVERGAELLAPTNQYELVRYRGQGIVSIIYENQRGKRSYTGSSQEAWYAFEKGNISFRFTERAPKDLSAGRRERRSVLIRTLVQRDGDLCFYCGDPFSDEKPPTKEHLVSQTAGGPDHIANLFLACGDCNSRAGHCSAAEKIKFRDLKRRGAGTTLLQDLRPHIEALAVTDEAPEFKALLGRIDAVIHAPKKETTNV